MHLRFALFALALGLAATPCALAAQDSVFAAQDSMIQDSAARARVQRFIFDGPGQWLGTGRDIPSRFGRPTTMSYTVIQNVYDSVPRDTMFTLQYDSATFVIWHVTNVSNQILIDATITGSRFLRRSPIRLGMSPRDVQVLLKDTSQTRTPPLVYYCPWCDEPVCCSSVTFLFNGTRLTAVSWHWTVD